MKIENLMLIFSVVFLLGAMAILQKITNDIDKIKPIYLDDKKNECVSLGGKYSVRDWSWKNEEVDYRATCEIPEKIIWEIKLSNPQRAE